MRRTIRSPLISIVFTHHDGPYGGGNQFLRALTGALKRSDHFTENLEKADVVIFNSHHDLDLVLKARSDHADKIFLHRIDGPMRLYNDPSDERDALVMRANRLMADATVFQSEWSRSENLRLGWPRSPFQSVIGNAPDPLIFNKSNRTPMGGKVRLIAASWSSNPNKGFDVYEYLDKNLDFEKYEMVFYGNSPIKFSNIRSYAPVESNELANQFKSSDIFITGSVNDPCSNTLIEALHCGLPAIARRSGGHPEIVGKGGELFDDAKEVPSYIDKVCNNYQWYCNNIRLPMLDEIADSYLSFSRELIGRMKKGDISPKRVGIAEKLWAFLNA